LGLKLVFSFSEPSVLYTNKIKQISQTDDEFQKINEILNAYDEVRDTVDFADINLNLPNISLKCGIQVALLLMATKDSQPWALQFFDSFAKPMT
jgi:hypothetical protein